MWDVRVPVYQRDLRFKGGRYRPPCLRIGQTVGETAQWLYESTEIIRYLEHPFPKA